MPNHGLLGKIIILDFSQDVQICADGRRGCKLVHSTCDESQGGGEPSLSVVIFDSFMGSCLAITQSAF